MNNKIFLVLFLTVGSAFAEDAMKFVSPDKSTTLVIDKSGKRDVVELQLADLRAFTPDDFFLKCLSAFR
jgi:hypothetical protein